MYTLSGFIQDLFSPDDSPSECGGITWFSTKVYHIVSDVNKIFSRKMIIHSAVAHGYVLAMRTNTLVFFDNNVWQANHLAKEFSSSCFHLIQFISGLVAANASIQSRFYNTEVDLQQIRFTVFNGNVCATKMTFLEMGLDK